MDKEAEISLLKAMTLLQSVVLSCVDRKRFQFTRTQQSILTVLSMEGETTMKQIAKYGGRFSWDWPLPAVDVVIVSDAFWLFQDGAKKSLSPLDAAARPLTLTVAECEWLGICAAVSATDFSPPVLPTEL